MKHNVLMTIGLCLFLVTLAHALPATSDAAEPAALVAPGPNDGSAATIRPLDAVEQTPEMKALRRELNAATATGDPAQIKAVHNRIQDLYLARQPRPVNYIKAEPVYDPPQGMRDPGPDILIAGGPVSTISACYTTDGAMYAAGNLPDSTARVFRSLDHGQTWNFLCGIRTTPNIIWPKVEVVVTEGDSARVFLFVIHPDQDGNAMVARYNLDGTGFLWLPVLAGPDTVGDFAFCADHDNWYYLYGAVYSTVRTSGTNGKMVRSTDLGKTWAVTNNFGNLNHVSYQNGAGRWQYLATASRATGHTGQINLLTNHSYGDPVFWREVDIRPDTFVIEEPVMCPAFTLPETAAVTWVAWHEINSARPTPITVLTSVSTDGCISYGPPQPIVSEPGAGDVWPDLQSYHSMGNTWMNLSYISLLDGHRRLYRRYCEASTPYAWSDTLRIGMADAYRSHLAKPRLCYSPGAPGSGGGCAFVNYSGQDFLWNAPWTSAVAEAPAPPRTVTLHFSANPVHTRADLRWTGPARSLLIHDASGRLVRTFRQPAGNHLTWDLTDTHNRPVGAGVYLVRITTAQGSVARPLVVQ